MSLTLSTETAVPGHRAATGEMRAHRFEPLDPVRLRRAKKAYTTRFVADAVDISADGYGLSRGLDVVPRAGDVVLARVEEIGMHKRLESPVSRRQALFVGDEILVAYGNRYAPDQYLAEVPHSLQQCQLVAGGGVAGTVTAQHAAVLDATTITPLGLLTTGSGVVNLAQYAPYRVTEASRPADSRPPVVVVLGSSMNSGKTTTTACLARGFYNAGLRVAAGKATGTGSGNDPRLFADAGASPVLDFTNFGRPTTSRQSPSETLDVLLSLIATLAESDPDVIVLEVADGLYQEETRRLLREPDFRATVDRVIYCALDALGAVAGARVLRGLGLPVAAVSGRVTASQLATAEAAGELDVPILETFALCEPAVASTVLPLRILTGGNAGL